VSEPSLFDLDSPPEAPEPEGPRSVRLAFERIAVLRMPGFEEGGFALDDLAHGVNVVHGPNASGKSTTARAIRRLLWPRLSSEGAAAATLRLGGERWEIEVDRDRVRHRRNGAPSDPPPLPPADAADRYSLALHDLLQADVRGDDLATAVAREAAGGYDVEAAREAAGARPKASRPRSLFDAYQAADAEARRVEDEQRRIAREAEELAPWEAELTEAREAEARVARLDAALEHARCRARLEEAERVLAGFPEAAGRLRGDENERLAEQRRRLEEARADHERLSTEAAAARRCLEESGLPEGGLDRLHGGLLTGLTERCRRVAQLEREIEGRERDLAGARRRREDARREVAEVADLADRAGTGGGEPDVDDRLRALAPADWRPVLELARRADELAADRAELDGLDAWSRHDSLGLDKEEVDRRLAAAGAETRLLHDWLREGGGGWRARLPALAAAVAQVALAVWGGLLGIPAAPWLWALAGVAAALVAWCWLDVSRDAGYRHRLETDHRRHDPSGSFHFRRDEVARRLADLESEVAGLRLERERLRSRAGLAERRKRFDHAAASLEEQRTAVLELLGLAPAVEAGEPAPLALLAQALGRWRQADGEVRGAEQALAEGRRQLDRELAAIREGLEPFGAEPPADAPAAQGAIEALKERVGLHRDATDRLARLDGEDGDLVRAAREAERAEQAIRDLFAGLELDHGDAAGLRRLLERLDDYREARECVDRAAAELRLAAGRLAEAPEEDGPALSERSEAELAAERAEAAAVAERKDALLDRIARLKGEIERLRHQHGLEKAQAERRSAADALRTHREAETRAVVAWELADWVRERATRLQRPAVLGRAAALFARITGGAFRLLDPVGDPPLFRAADSRTGRTRELDELSGGRRLQLLVAARMGFVEEQERGVRVPLVLDETLANSDDESAAALIEAITEIAREGRQVFYLTAQADEVAKWEAALGKADGVEWRTHDLAAVRRGEEASRAPRGDWRPRERSVPAPEGADRASYAERLGVPGIDPRRAVGEVHVWHLVEEVTVLHGLLARGIERWGELETLLRDGGGEVVGGSVRARIEARARCCRVLIEGWSTGRGRPIDRQVIQESGAVSERFLDEVCDLAASLAGSADALLEALEEGRVSGFRSQKTAELAVYLAETGHRDEREVLDAAGLRERALSEMAAQVAAGELTVDAVDELLAQLADPGPP
jgi:hypothetical protein